MTWLHSEALLRLIYSAENQIPVNDYVVDGVHVWPIVRMTLCYGTVNNDADNDPEITGNSFWQQLVAAIETRFQADYAVRQPLYRGDRRLEDFLPRPGAGTLGRRVASMTHDLLFFVRADEHFQKMDGGFRAPVLDPWYEAAVARQMRVMKFEYLSEQLSLERMPRWHPTFLLPRSPCLLPAQTTPALSEALLESCDALSRRLSKWIETQFGLFLNPDQLAQAAQRNLRSAYYFKCVFDRLFQQISAPAILLNCYYHMMAFGLSWSAQHHGILTAEVQHGINGEAHMGYTHWSVLPPGGYCMLPTVFITWGLSAANNIARWWSDAPCRHQVIIGGKPAVSAERNESDRNSLMARRDGFKKTLLVTLQTTQGTAISELLLALFKEAPADWLWLVRAHPMAEPQRATYSKRGYIEEQLSEAGISNVECEITTRISLDDLLPLAEHHITYLSSVVFEALRYRIPTTFIHPAAPRNFYRTLIQEQVAYYGATPEAILASIQRGTAGINWERAEQELLADPERIHQTLAILAG